MTAYYNEHDPYAAEWLRMLILLGEIAPGDVDERDISDVTPGDLAGYTQCHFFAGIGGWSHALRLAGWPDDRPVWTGSCPCQPFSAAGKGAGFADERHLWPAWFHLIEQCRPAIVFGEQVAAKAALQWFDLVCADLEAAGYAVGAADLCAAGVGAPHIRQRLYWLADADRRGNDAQLRAGQNDSTANVGRGTTVRLDRQVARGDEGESVRLADSSSTRLERRDARTLGHECAAVERSGGAGELADVSSEGRRSERTHGDAANSAEALRGAGPAQSGRGGAVGFWSAAEWLPCRDGKARPVEPGTFPLAHGVPNRVGRLRAYGNAIVPQVASEFIGAYLESEIA
jgi:DNA (cytosine-5)-methyltransferase 1